MIFFENLEFLVSKPERSVSPRETCTRASAIASAAVMNTGLWCTEVVWRVKRGLEGDHLIGSRLVVGIGIGQLLRQSCTRQERRFHWTPCVTFTRLVGGSMQPHRR